jgi:hypothetical protein
MLRRHFELLAERNLVLQPPSVGLIASANGPVLAAGYTLDINAAAVEWKTWSARLGHRQVEEDASSDTQSAHRWRPLSRFFRGAA